MPSRRLPTEWAGPLSTPFYAQANAPMLGDRCSTWLLNATLGWAAYLERRVKATVSSTLARRHWVCWTDASGADRLLAAVIASPSGIFFARARVPDWIWRQSLPREDHQIGVQEALAIWLLVSSFKSRLLDCLVSVFVDNDGVSASFINGSSDCPEVNAMVAVFWIQMAELRCDAVFHRVESASNIADGPTRPEKEGCQVLELVGAVEKLSLIHI